MVQDASGGSLLMMQIAEQQAQRLVYQNPRRKLVAPAVGQAGASAKLLRASRNLTSSSD